VQLDLGAVVAATHPGAATVAFHPPEDRLAHAEPVGGHVVEVEAGAAVAHEGLDPARPDLDVGRHRGLPVSHRVEQGLAQRTGPARPVLLVSAGRRSRRARPGTLEVLHLVG
jgi:hypothetical protein